MGLSAAAEHKGGTPQASSTPPCTCRVCRESRAGVHRIPFPLGPKDLISTGCPPGVGIRNRGEAWAASSALTSPEATFPLSLSCFFCEVGTVIGHQEPPKEAVRHRQGEGMGHPTSFCPLPRFPLQFHSEALTRALSLARPVGNSPPRARPFSLQLSRGFLSTRQESCAGSEGPGGFGLRAAWQRALVLQEGSHLAGPSCWGNQPHNILLPAGD